MNRRLILNFVAALVSVSVGPINAREPKSPPKPAELRKTIHFMEYVAGFPDTTEVDGIKYVMHKGLGFGLAIDESWPRDDSTPKVTIETYTINPQPRQLLPLLGGIYQVKKLRPRSFDAVLVEDAVVLSKYGIDRQLIGVSSGGFLKFEDLRQIYVKDIKKIKDPLLYGVLLEITTYLHADLATRAEEAVERIFSAGDSFNLGDATFTIEKIVPPEIKDNVYGWVEFSMKPNPKAKPRAVAK